VQDEKDAGIGSVSRSWALTALARAASIPEAVWRRVANCDVAAMGRRLCAMPFDGGAGNSRCSARWQRTRRRQGQVEASSQACRCSRDLQGYLNTVETSWMGCSDSMLIVLGLPFAAASAARRPTLRID